MVPFLLIVREKRSNGVSKCHSEDQLSCEWENANWSDTNELIVTHGKKGAIYKEKIFRASADVWDALLL